MYLNNYLQCAATSVMYSLPSYHNDQFAEHVFELVPVKIDVSVKCSVIDKTNCRHIWQVSCKNTAIRTMHAPLIK